MNEDHVSVSARAVDKDDALGLLKEASAEIAAYRQRQLTTFREAVIVPALITWGVSRIPLQANLFGLTIRILAAIACCFAGYTGWKIIMSYKKRIYHVRDRRSALARLMLASSGASPADLDPFYPTDSKNLDGARRSAPSSHIYSALVIAVAFLAAAINVLARWAVADSGPKP